MKTCQKEKYEALQEAMEIILMDNHLVPGDQGYQIIRDYVSSMIDRMGPEKAMLRIKITKAPLQTKAACIAAMS